MMSSSTPATGARNLAMLQLVIPASSIAPVLHGRLTATVFSFEASFAFGIASAIGALWLVLKLPSNPVSRAGQT